MTYEQPTPRKIIQCPYCQYTDVVIVIGEVDRCHSAYCENCEARGPRYDTYEQAVSAWERIASMFNFREEAQPKITDEERRGRVVIVFDGPPGNESGRFIEVERDGASIKFGEWVEDGKYWMLVLPATMGLRQEFAEGRDHLTETGNFQSDKFRWCGAGFVPLKLSDPAARDLLVEYARRRTPIDTAFPVDLGEALGNVKVKHNDKYAPFDSVQDLRADLHRLEYILEDDYERRSLSWLVCETHNRIILNEFLDDSCARG